MAWTDDVVADLKKMWAEGLTTGEIAKRLDVSKNSVVGKVHRLGLSGRPSPIKKKAEVETTKIEIKQAPKTVKKEKPIAVKPIKAPIEVKKEVIDKTIKQERPIKKEIEFKLHKEGSVRVTDLDTHTCRWPIGDPKDEKFHFCGKRIRVGQTYCEEHSEIAYVKQTKK